MSVIKNTYNNIRAVGDAARMDYMLAAGEHGGHMAALSARWVAMLGMGTAAYVVLQESAMGVGATKAFVAGESVAPGLGIAGAALAGGSISAASEFMFGSAVAHTVPSMPNTVGALTKAPDPEQSSVSKGANTAAMIAAAGSPGSAVLSAARNPHAKGATHQKAVNKTAVGLMCFGTAISGVYGAALAGVKAGVHNKWAEAIMDYAQDPRVWIGAVITLKALASANDALGRAQARHNTTVMNDNNWAAGVRNTIGEQLMPPETPAPEGPSPLVQAWAASEARQQARKAKTEAREASRWRRMAKATLAARARADAESMRQENEQVLDPARLVTFLKNRGKLPVEPNKLNADARKAMQAAYGPFALPEALSEQEAERLAQTALKRYYEQRDMEALETSAPPLSAEEGYHIGHALHEHFKGRSIEDIANNNTYWEEPHALSALFADIAGRLQASPYSLRRPTAITPAMAGGG